MKHLVLLLILFSRLLATFCDMAFFCLLVAVHLFPGIPFPQVIALFVFLPVGTRGVCKLLLHASPSLPIALHFP